MINLCRTIVYDGHAFFLLHNLLTDQSGDNLMIITILLLAESTSKVGPHPRLSPCQSSCKQHVPGWARSRKGVRLQPLFLVSRSPGRRMKRHPRSRSPQARDRLYGPEFPQMFGRNDVPCICPLHNEVHIADNMSGYTNTLNHLGASSVVTAIGGLLSSVAILRLRRSTTALFRRQPADHPWYTGTVYMQVQLPHTEPVHTPNPIITYHSGDSFESWFRHRRQAMPHPKADACSPAIENQTSRQGLIFFVSYATCGAYTRRRTQSIAVHKSIQNWQQIFHTSNAKTTSQKQKRGACIQKRDEHGRGQRSKRKQ